ncbi:hypothetical protein UPYG_G00237300 [Umbra pygmaea]|uniref:Ig-like domain-containing protein n=1 Tax=Umbra pygmaea TaxID=75934 RepID=A0ABD0WEQ6_UMBPY
MDYNLVNYTLCIRNIMANESGTYVASYDREWKVLSFEYRLAIQKAVPLPTMQVTYSNSSSGICNVTVNCSGWEWSVCTGEQCLPFQQSLSLSDFNVSVSSNNGVIQCTVNNYVSTKTVLQSIEHTSCKSSNDSKASTLPMIGYSCIAVCSICAIVGIATISARKCRSAEEEQALQVRPVGVPQRMMPGPQPPSESDVNTIYVTAGIPRAAAGDVGYAVEEERLGSPQAESISTVQPPVIDRHPLRKVGASPEDRPVDSTSVYSAVQKPLIPQRHQVFRNRNVSNTDTVYCTIGGKLPLHSSQ